MAIVALLLPLSLLLAIAFVCAFRWAARNGQFDDLDRTACTPLAADLYERGCADSPGRCAPCENQHTPSVAGLLRSAGSAATRSRRFHSAARVFATAHPAVSREADAETELVVSHHKRSRVDGALPAFGAPAAGAHGLRSQPDRQKDPAHGQPTPSQEAG